MQLPNVPATVSTEEDGFDGECPMQQVWKGNYTESPLAKETVCPEDKTPQVTDAVPSPQRKIARVDKSAPPTVLAASGKPSGNTTTVDSQFSGASCNSNITLASAARAAPTVTRRPSTWDNINAGLTMVAVMDNGGDKGGGDIVQPIVQPVYLPNVVPTATPQALTSVDAGEVSAVSTSTGHVADSFVVNTTTGDSNQAGMRALDNAKDVQQDKAKIMDAEVCSLLMQ